MTIVFQYSNIYKEYSPAKSSGGSVGGVRWPFGGPDPRGINGLYYGAGELPSQIRRQERVRVSGELEKRFSQLKTALEQILAEEEASAAPSSSAALSPTSPYLASPLADSALRSEEYPPAPCASTFSEIITSTWQTPDAAVTLLPGSYSVLLELEGQSRELHLELKEVPGDTSNSPAKMESWQGLLGNLAESLNQADSRLQVSLEHNVIFGESDSFQPWGAKVRLRIQAARPEQALPPFTLRDMGQGKLIRSLGLESQPLSQLKEEKIADSRPQEEGKSAAPDEIYEKQAAVDMDKFEALPEAEEPVSRLVGAFHPLQAENQALSQVLSAYHGLLDYLDINRDILRPSLKDILTRSLQDRASLLPELGLRVTPQGQLSLRLQFEEIIPNKLKQLHELLLGRQGWLPALRQSIERIDEIKPEAFVMEQTPLANAWELDSMEVVLEELVGTIINGKY